MDLFYSKNLRTFLILSEFSYSQIELRLSLFCCQNSISVSGPGCFPFFKAFSGSNFNTFLICLVQWLMAFSKSWALSLLDVFSLVVISFAGRGSIVLPLI